MSGDKTCITFFLAWHLAFNPHSSVVSYVPSRLALWLAWASLATVMRATPCYIGLCLSYLPRLCHLFYLPLLLCLFYLPLLLCLVYLPLLCHLGNVKYQYSPLLDIQLLVYTRYCCPFLIISSVSRSWMSTRLQFSAHCFHHVVQSSFTLDSSLVRCYGVFRYALVVMARTFVRPLFSYICLSLVRRAFLHQSILFSFVSPLPQGVSPPIYSLQLCFSFAAGRFSINSD